MTMKPQVLDVGNVLLSDLGAFWRALADLAGAPVLFVDDCPDNLRAAQSFGWHTLLADGDGRWTRMVEPLLRQPG
jgi:FMN phosphatase YigB (HAD superfamily)